MADPEDRGLTPLQLAAAVIAGLVLAGLPLARFVLVSGHGAAHTDHRPWHGGQLAMVGDHHVELRRTREGIEAFVSDARRGSVQPAEAWARLDGEEPVALAIGTGRLWAATDEPPEEIELDVVLRDGTRLTIAFDLRTETENRRTGQTGQ